MSILALVADQRVADVEVSQDTLSVRMMDGRTISVPIVWYPRLLKANDEQRKNWKIVGGGYGIHWPDIDEDLSTEGLLRGAPARHRKRSGVNESEEDVKEEKGVDYYVTAFFGASNRTVDILNNLHVEQKTLVEKLTQFNENISRVKSSEASYSDFEKVASLLASELGNYCNRVEELIPELNQDLDILESSLAAIIDLLEPNDVESKTQAASIRAGLSKILAGVSAGKKINIIFRNIFEELSEKNLTNELNNALIRQIRVTSEVLASFEQIESFALRLMFKLNEKFGSSDPAPSDSRKAVRRSKKRRAARSKKSSKK